MTIFVIFRVSDTKKMSAALERAFPKNHLLVAQGQWLVSAAGTAKDVSDKLGITEGASGAATIFSMGNYFGRAPTDVWEWIKTKAEQANG